MHFANMLRLLSCCCFWLLFQFPILALEVHILDWGIEGYTSRSHVALTEAVKYFSDPDSACEGVGCMRRLPLLLELSGP